MTRNEFLLKPFWIIEDLLIKFGYENIAEKLEKVEDRYYNIIWNLFN